MTFYLNDQMIKEITDNSISKGSVALGVSVESQRLSLYYPGVRSFGEADIFFDNLKISAP